MTATTTHEAMVPCPVCGTRFGWPPTTACTGCGADLQGPAAATFWQLARDEADLRARQAEAWQQLAATAGPMAPSATRGTTRQHRLTDLRAQTVLGVAGAALLAVAAVVFAAVTWQDLPDAARGAILLGAAASAIALALRLQRRRLQVTASAVGLLAAALTATVVWAVHTYGATGQLVDTGGGALAALGAAAVAAGLGRRGIRWQASAATGAWLLAVLLGWLAVVDVTSSTAAVPLLALSATAVAALPAFALPDGGPHRRVLWGAGAVGLAGTAVLAATVLAVTDGPAVTSPVAAGLVTAALWLRLGGPLLGVGAATAGTCALAVGGLVTFDLTDTVLLVGIAGVAFVVAAAALATPRRLPFLVGSAPVAGPAVLWTSAGVVSVLDGWGQHVASPWRATGSGAPDIDAWMAAAALLTAGTLVLATVGTRPEWWRRVAGNATPVAASLAVWFLGGSMAALVLVAAVGAVAGVTRLDGSRGRTTWVAWAVVAVGWSLPSPTLSAMTAAAVAAVALSAHVAPVGRHPGQAAVAVVMAATAGAAGTVRLLGDTQADDLAGPVAVAAAVAAAAAGRRLGLHGRVAAVSMTTTGVMATAATSTVATLLSTAGVTAALAVGTVVLAVVWRGDVVAARLHAATALAAATLTSWLLLGDAGTTTPEAYTAVPAALALGAGVAWMVRDPTVPSRALHPGLVLAVVPTLGLLVLDPQDTTRAVAAAAIAAVMLLVGVTRRVATPVWYGAAAAAVVVLTQLAVVAGHVPRWVVFAVLGALLVAASATFERQRSRGRRVQERLGHMAATYR